MPVENLVIGSPVFALPDNELSPDDPSRWWRYVAGANWLRPKGSPGLIANKPGDPVVQICYEDAIAFAKWAGKRLPTEAE